MLQRIALASGIMANELNQERSPYLRQHAQNPVHWKTWGIKAFELAKKRDVPLLLSIGYSTCHWCHVMERECFDDKLVAKQLNDHFVAIKVDREELPEVDSLYMDALQMMTQHGGWPLNVFLDHELRPFYGCTYTPKANFLKLLSQIVRMWKERRPELQRVAGELAKHLSQREELQLRPSSKNLIQSFLKSSERRFDLSHGGHEGAPKFPMNYEAIACLRLGDIKMRSRISFYLRKLLSGGIWDHVGGGIHRYSTDEEWRVPHFEKMLYDQASLLMVLAESLALENDSFLRSRAETLIDYLERDLRSPAGVFFAAEDADSEGHEGTFYVWTYDELKSQLTSSELALLKEHFEISASGNWEGKIIFHSGTWETEDFSGIWRKLRTVREKRHRPFRDEKILTAWNGLMIAALARYSRAVHSERALLLAQGAADFLERELFRDGKLYRRFIAGERKHTAQLEDYSFFVEALRELYLSSSEIRYLNLALTLQDIAQKEFWRDNLGYVSNVGENVWRDHQEYSDNVTPSGIASSHLNLLWLSELAHREDFRELAVRISKKFPPSLEQFPIIYPRLIEFYHLSEVGIESVAILLADQKLRESALKQVAPYRFDRAVLASTSTEHPLLAGKVPKFPATYYICRNQSCQEANDTY